jgi:hypothetical protein
MRKKVAPGAGLIAVAAFLDQTLPSPAPRVRGFRSFTPLRAGGEWRAAGYAPTKAISRHPCFDGAL